MHNVSTINSLDDVSEGSCGTTPSRFLAGTTPCLRPALIVSDRQTDKETSGGEWQEDARDENKGGRREVFG